ncbi:MAG: hypothetical protein AAFQ87_12140, partial [Bacteroidota bacterium]
MDCLRLLLLSCFMLTIGSLLPELLQQPSPFQAFSEGASKISILNPSTEEEPASYPLLVENLNDD